MRHTTHKTILVIIVCHFASYPCLLSAEPKTIIVQPHDSLSNIVNTYYPDGIPSTPVMRAIVERNPEAFINNSIHRLISGKQLVLPEFEGISPVSNAPPLKNTQQTNPQLLNKRITSLEALHLQLTTQIKQLETSKQLLQEQVTRDESEKKEKENKIKELTDQVAQLKATITSPDINAEKNSQILNFKETIANIEKENQSLQQQLASTQQALDDQEQENQRLNEQLTLIKSEQSSSATAFYWLWGLGLLGLLLPLLWWLFRQKKTSKKATPQTQTTGFAATPTTLSADSVTPLSIAETDSIQSNSQNESHIKLNIARAYMDMRTPEAAVDLLEEVIREGNSQQKQQAQEILSFIT